MTAAPDEPSDGDEPSEPDPPEQTPPTGEQASLHDHLRAARDELGNQFARTKADFDQANARIKQRTGRDLVLAILIGLAIGAVVLLSLIIWKPVFVAVALVGVVLAVLELCRALAGGGRRVDLAPQLVLGAVVVLSARFTPLWLHALVCCAAVLVVIAWRLVAQAFARDGRPASQVREDVTAAAFVQIYVSFLASLCVVLLGQPGGQWWVLAFVIVAVVSDTAAYASGLTLGRGSNHKMAPRISPNKTWEGFGGAVVGALVAGFVLAVFMLSIPWWAGLVFGAVILGSATIGDLGESMIKRDLGIKDMSGWIPGHGGVLDRLDSILPSAGAALAMYFLLSPLTV